MEKDGVRGVRLSDGGECLGERCGAAGRDAPEVVRGGGGERMHEDRGDAPHHPYMCLLIRLTLYLKLQVTVSYSRHP